MANNVARNEVLTWYAASAGLVPDFPAIAGEFTADVCVIGGGFAGLTTALELARAGLKVALLEAASVGAGASGRNGGFVSNGYALGIDQINKRVGKTDARTLFALSRSGTEYVRREIARGDPSIKMGDGWLVMSRSAKQDLHEYGESLNHLVGENLSYLSRDEVRNKVRSPRYFSGLVSNTAFHIHPLRYVHLLAKNIVQAGSVIFENSRVGGVTRRRDGYKVTTSQGSVFAKQVVYCVSAFDRKLHAVSGRATLPVATYIAVTEPLAQRDIMTRAALSDTRRAGDYYRLIAEDRVLWGGRITTRTSSPPELAAKLRNDMLDVFPTWRDAKIEFCWVGLMGYALHKMPLIGTDGRGQWYATAFGGHGLNTTAMAGQLIASAIAIGDERYKIFAAFQPMRSFGKLGRAGVQASYWSMQVRDWWDEL